MRKGREHKAVASEEWPFEAQGKRVAREERSEEVKECNSERV